MSYYFAWQPYILVAEKRRRAEREEACEGDAVEPIAGDRAEALPLLRQACSVIRSACRKDCEDR